MENIFQILENYVLAWFKKSIHLCNAKSVGRELNNNLFKIVPRQAVEVLQFFGMSNGFRSDRGRLKEFSKMRNPKFEDVSARVLLTPMPKDGVDQFTFMRPLGELKATHVEALLQFSQFMEPLYLMRGLNKLISGYIVGPDDDLSPGDMLEIERLISFLADLWEVERGTFEPLHKTFAVKQE